MIISNIFDINCTEGLTKNIIEKIFIQKKIKPVKWAIVSVSENLAKILVSFEKNS